MLTRMQRTALTTVDPASRKSEGSHLANSLTPTGPSFQHPDLDQTVQQIRLLRLEPKHADDQHVRAQLCTFDLQSAPEYSALSYTWGTRKCNQFILVNGVVFEVGLNLYCFLCEFQDSEEKAEERWLWIDQICINQGNDKERNHQVRMMAEIYSQAIETIVWLSDDRTDDAVGEHAEVKESRLTAAFKALLPELQADDLEHQYESRREALRDPSTRERLRQNFDAIRRNSYFTRLWIVQEIILAQSVRILVQGGIRVPWNNLFWLRTLLMDAGVRGYGVLPFVLFERPGASSGPRQSHLVDCVFRYRTSECTDPRDKVYGLLGIVQTEASKRIVVDYSKTVPELLLDVLVVELSTAQRSINWDSLRCIARPLGLSGYDDYGWTRFIIALQEHNSVPQHGPIPCQIGTSSPSQPHSIAIGYSPSTDPLDKQPDTYTYRPSIPTIACWWYELDTKGMQVCFPCRVPSSWTKPVKPPRDCYHTAQAFDEVLLGNKRVEDRRRWAKPRARRYLEKIKDQTRVSLFRK